MSVKCVGVGVYGWVYSGVFVCACVCVCVCVFLCVCNCVCVCEVPMMRVMFRCNKP